MSALQTLLNEASSADLVTTDVFDTLLLRSLRSERERILMGDRVFSRRLAKRGLSVAAGQLSQARLVSQQLAFRALDTSGTSGEVRLSAIIERQLRLLGLPTELAPERISIELEIEKTSLAPNVELANRLRQLRSDKRRVVAVSDSTLSGTDIAALLEHFHGPGVVDAVYSSADLGLTKRRGDIFKAVSEAERVPVDRIVHVGDDAGADYRTPRRVGLAAVHLPRPKYLSRLRRLKGAAAEGLRLTQDFASRPARTGARPNDLRGFGFQVMGPIVAEFCQRIWLYLSAARDTGRPVLLFCARGGVGIREAFETTLQRLELPFPIRRQTLMVSRLVAARAALLARGPSVADELRREFRKETHGEVAAAVGGGSYSLPDEWGQRFDAARFLDLLFGPSGAEVLADVQRQHELFDRHFRSLAGDADRIILCDTGLYGSTQRMLMNSYPALSIETIQFARSNYKGHAEDHFPKVVGLMVERRGFNPLVTESCVLRYWHLIESLFEPAVPSVRSFREDVNGEVTGNCGDIRFGEIDAAASNDLLAGVLDYIGQLDARASAQVRLDARSAWSRLRRSITDPSSEDLAILQLGERSVDFGRSGAVPVTSSLSGKTLRDRLAGLHGQLWREGAIASEFPVSKHALLPLLGSMQSIRGLLQRSP